jgi:SAM-dependent methyltransferase
MEGYNVNSLRELFPTVTVNLDFYANSRGGLLPDLYGKVKDSHFKIADYCVQPTQNFNILFDGSIIACCIDWMHESKKDYGNVNYSTIEELYSKVRKLQDKFNEGDYSVYRMCEMCSTEMGFERKKENKSRLKILITNHHLLDYTGSEILTYTLADYLSRSEYQVTVYSKYLGGIKSWFDKKNIRIVDNLQSISKESFDIIHVHHNISAIEVRYWYPKAPIVFYSQGVLPFLEQPPLINTSINKYLAISEEVKANFISQGIDQEKIEIVRNIIDSEKFSSNRIANNKPQNVLVISGRIDTIKEQIINDTCSELGLILDFVGGRFGTVDQSQLKEKIEWADIIFSLGRGAIEGMIAGRAVVIYDYLGGDGIVTSHNYSEIQKNNFSGRCFSFDYCKNDLVNEIKKYNLEEIQKVQKLAIEDYAAKNIVQQLKEIYIGVINNPSENHISPEIEALIKSTYNTIFETYNYAYESGFRKGNVNSSANKISFELEIAEEFINDERYDIAKEIILKILDQDSLNYSALNDLSVINIIEGKHEDAVKIIKAVLSMDPQNEIALGNLEYVRQKQIEMTESDYLAPKPSEIKTISLSGEESKSNLSIYERKLLAEQNTYNNITNVHDLPEINKVINAMSLSKWLNELTGKQNHMDWWANEIKIRYAEVKRPIRILSIGCGNGDVEIDLMNRLKNLDLHLLGLDINKAMLERANLLAQNQKCTNAKFEYCDLNNLHLEGFYDIFIASHSLHHIVELEKLFIGMNLHSAENAIFLVNDMIGRNGHVMWPVTEQVVSHIWDKLDRTFKFNGYTRKFDEKPMNDDCSKEGFEGICAEDILPLMEKYFNFEIFLPFSCIINRFTDRGYGHNFHADIPEERALMETILKIDLQLLSEKRLSPVQMMAQLRPKGWSGAMRHKFQTPEEVISLRMNNLTEQQALVEAEAIILNLNDIIQKL